MFLAMRETVLAGRGGIGGRLATRFGVAHRSSFRSGVREDTRFGPTWPAGPHSAPEQEAASRIVLPWLGRSHSAPERSVFRGLG